MQLYIDSTDRSRSLSASEIRTQVRQLVGGLKSNGLKKSDCVCVVSFNDVGFVTSISSFIVLFMSFRSTTQVSFSGSLALAAALPVQIRVTPLMSSSTTFE